jgi:hypothetical protein
MFHFHLLFSRLFRSTVSIHSFQPLQASMIKITQTNSRSLFQLYEEFEFVDLKAKLWTFAQSPEFKSAEICSRISVLEESTLHHEDDFGSLQHQLVQLTQVQEHTTQTLTAALQ